MNPHDRGIVRVACELGYPKTIRLDNGPEFISKELDLWAFTAQGQIKGDVKADELID
jgi:hypothetical protein